LLPKLCSERVTYFPIRHHSPACAFHIKRLIFEKRPTSILVEGPESFTSRIDALTHELCKSPVALFTNFVDKKRRLSQTKRVQIEDQDNDEAPNDKPLRFGAYYPFCDYSPELVALRAGKEIGANLRFIDLNYGEKLLAQHSAQSELFKEHHRLESLTQDSHLRHSNYIKELTSQLGLRDFDEVWDHLFESHLDTLTTDAFIARVATYCTMARLSYSEKDLRCDGTIMREECMASCIVDEIEKQNGHILVVTGGFHTVALPDLVTAKTKRPKPIDFASDESETWIMRYSFNRLDSYSGYESGIPSPAYYDRLWQIAEIGTDSLSLQFDKVAVEILSEVSAEVRKRKLPSTISTPDTIAAASMTKQLAALRGHPWPMREDILDGIRSCFIKGELAVEGRVLLRLVRDVLAGNKVGEVPPDTDQPPIVSDFYREAKQFRLPVDRVDKKEYSLDLYRSASHRGMSRLFHRLGMLGAPFARYIDGPDFVTGMRLNLMQERWEVEWSPLLESTLIEASIYGVTIEEAVSTKLSEAIAILKNDGAGRSTDAAVTILVRACRLGLYTTMNEVVPMIASHIAEDPNFQSVVKGLSQLELLQNAKEPLEAMHLNGLPVLMTAAYQRACLLLQSANRCPEDTVEGFMHSMQTLREVLASCEENTYDEELFFESLSQIVFTPPHEAHSAIVGAAAGILYGEGRLDSDSLIRVICGYLGGAIVDPRKSTGVIRGLLTTACEITWQVSDILNALNNQLEQWDENVFLEQLPQLRLAFTSLTPRDIARVAEHLVSINDGESLGELVHTDLTENELAYGLRLDEGVRQALQKDGLAVD
jgi:hypothetical protein